MNVLFVNADDTARHVRSANTAIYPNLGLLTLMSSLATRMPRERLAYLDGTVHGNSAIRQFITEHAHSLGAICFSSLTANHGASVGFAQQAKSLNPNVTVIFGNDHFSALAERVMLSNPVIDYGFFGNDVVEGFTCFVADLLAGRTRPLTTYPGLVYRHGTDEVVIADNDPPRLGRNPEDPSEYSRLPLVDYSLMDSALPHSDRYLAGQQRTYFFMRDRNLRSQVVDIGRGCVKFTGERVAEIPLNACDFCGIIPGGKPITTQNAERAWQILENVYKQGYNYFYVTADELPLTMSGMLRKMAAHKPAWYQDLREKPKMFGYARAEGFETQPGHIETLVKELGFDHFFVGFDGMSEVSLRAMNKQSMTPRYAHKDMVQQNLLAFRSLVAHDCLVTAGLVVTHLGITPQIMEENYRVLERIVSAHPTTFAALDFGPLCPIPGSLSFRYFTHPETAERRAMELGLRVNRPYLDSIKERYLTSDTFDMNEMINDFVMGCCPAINQQAVDDYVERVTELANRYNIVVGGGV